MSDFFFFFFATLWTNQVTLYMEFFQARIPEWFAISFSRGSSQLRDEPMSPALAGGSLPLSYLGSLKLTFTFFFYVLYFPIPIQRLMPQKSRIISTWNTDRGGLMSFS